MFADGGLLSPLKGVQGFNMSMKPAIDISSIDIKGVPLTGKPKTDLGLSSLGNVASGLFGSLISSPTGALQDTQNPEDFEVSTSTSREDLLKRMNTFEDVDFGSKNINAGKTGFTQGLSGVMSGVSAGASAGPLGMIAGGIGGLAKGIFGGIKAKKQKKKLQKAEEEATQKQLDAFSQQNTALDLKDTFSTMSNYYADGGDINIKPSKRGTFTAAAKQRGYGVQEFANKVLNNKENYSEAMRKKAQFAHNAAQWQHANGGELIEFNNGDSHEQNPFGGIPMGIGPNGLPNTVEQGETMKDNYVYSDRNKIDEELIEATGLSNNLKGKTFAEASKIIQEEAKERPNDPISKRGLERSLGILREAQELYNEVNMPKQSNNEFAIGGVLNKIGTGVSNAMEYAPLAFNLGTAFSNLNQKPEVVDLPELSSPEKLQSRSVYTPTDRNYIANQIRGIGRANERNIRNTAGGSSGATMAGLLASNYGTQKNIGEAFATIDRMNLGQKQNIAKEQMQADQFNISNQAAVDRYNTEMLMREQDLNARNRAAARAAKQKGFGVVAENLGQLSQANLMKDMSGMAYGYTWDKSKRRWIKE